MEKLKELQKDINLTDDDIIIIIFTSLDLDWFTNQLVIAAEFTKWFTMDFEGESREELDFKENKQEIWVSTVTYAQEVL